jgi:hypothetical protein
MEIVGGAFRKSSLARSNRACIKQTTVLTREEFKDNHLYLQDQLAPMPPVNRVGMAIEEKTSPRDQIGPES